MRILIDISHPAHVHFFRESIRQFARRGHEVQVVSRVKDITTELLDLYNIEHSILSTAPKKKNIFFFTMEMVTHCFKLSREVRRFKPDVMLQIAGTFIAPVGKLFRTTTVVFYDTEFATISNAIAYPLADYICTPDCYERVIKRNHIIYPGYHELAYLHPDIFKPDVSILKANRLEVNDKFFIVRFVGWTALHDYEEEGFTLENKYALIQMLAKHGKVLISSESELPPELFPFQSHIPYNDIHDVMAFASLVIGESSTMASEAAVLGVPAVFISTTPRGYTTELENRFELVKNYSPAEQEKCLVEVEGIISKPREMIQAEYQQRRATMLKEKCNVHQWQVDFVESLQ